MRGLKIGGVCALSALLMIVTGCGSGGEHCADLESGYQCGGTFGYDGSVRQLEAAIGPWTSGSAMAVSDTEIVVADEDNGAVVFMSRITGEVARTVELGGRPSELVLGPDGDVWVTLRSAGQVARIKAGGHEASHVETVGLEPTGLALSVDGSVLVVALWGEDTALALEPDTLRVLDTTPVGARPRTVSINSESVVTVAGDLGVRSRLRFDGQRFVHLDTGRVNGFDEQVTLIELNNGMVLPGMVLGAVVHPERDEPLFVHQSLTSRLIAVTDAGPVDAATSYYGPPPVSVGEVIGSQGEATTGPAMTFDPVAVEDKNSAVPFEARPRQVFPNLSLPRAIAHHPSLTLAVVAGMASDTVAFIGTGDADVKFLKTYDAGQAPMAVAFSPDGRFVYVMNAHEHTVFEILLFKQEQNPVAVVNRQGPRWEVAFNPFQSRLFSYGQSPLSAKMQRGRRLFTFVGDFSNPLGCQNCHFEGGDDGMIRVGLEGMRQTPALAGRLSDTAPFAWNGSSALLSDHVQSTMGRFGHGAFSAQELEDMVAFLNEGLREPVRPAIMAADAAQLERGRLVFEDPGVGCADCHSGAMTTDRRQHRLGISSEIESYLEDIRVAMGVVQEEDLGSFDTPSLRNLRFTAPYFHNGSAPTLEDVLDMTDGVMGNTGHLSAQEREDLLAYLRSL